MVFIRYISTPSTGNPASSTTDNVLSPVIFAVQVLAETSHPSPIIKPAQPAILSHRRRTDKPTL